MLNKAELSSNDEENKGLNSNTPESPKLMNKIMKYFKSGEKAPEETDKGVLSKFTGAVKSSIEVEVSYTTFFILLSIGVGLMCLSMMFLPIVVVSPQKFVSLFSLGSSIILISFVFIYGTAAYLDLLFSKSRIVISIMFIFSIFLGLYFAFFQSFYLISLICAVFQLVALIIFTLSFIPGGQMGISFCWSMFTSPINNLMMKVTGKSFLPS